MRLSRNRDFAIIPNMILEAVAFGTFNLSERKVLTGLYRLVFGWDRWERKIVRKELAKMIRLSESHTSDTITSLTKKGVIYTKLNRIGFERESTVWEKFLPEGSIFKVPSTGKSSSLQREVEFPPEGRKSSLQRESTKEKKESFKESFKKRVFTKKIREEKREEIEKGLAMLKEAVGKIPDRKRENH
jgi:phage replication O-like protein O